MKGKHLEETNKKRVIIGLFACLTLFFTTMQVQAKDIPMDKWWNLPKLSTALNLTGNDKQALDNLYAQNHDTMSALMSSLKKEHLKLEVILEENPVDETALNNQSN